MAAIPPALTPDARGRPVELMFGDDKDRPIGRTWFHRAVWRPAVLAAGLPTGSHFHELRHFYASLLIDGGESVKVVQAPARTRHRTAAHLLGSRCLRCGSQRLTVTQERLRTATDNAACANL